MKLVVNGLAGAGTIEFGGYDYHDSTRATGERQGLRRRPGDGGGARVRGAPRPPAHALRLQRRLGRFRRHARQLGRRARQGRLEVRRFADRGGLHAGLRSGRPAAAHAARARSRSAISARRARSRRAPRASRTTSTSSSRRWCSTTWPCTTRPGASPRCCRATAWAAARSSTRSPPSSRSGTP